MSVKGRGVYYNASIDVPYGDTENAGQDIAELDTNKRSGKGGHYRT